MKVRISFTVEVDEQFRRALAAYYSCPGLASREDVKQWYKLQATANDFDMQLDGQRMAEEAVKAAMQEQGREP